MHVPVRPEENFDSVRGFARDVAGLLVSRSPAELTQEQRKDQRGQRLYLDVMRNAYSQTAIAPYSVRARRGAPVATPLDWAELSDSGLSARRFTLRTMADRLATSADPWEGMARRRHGLAGPRRRFEALRAGARR